MVAELFGRRPDATHTWFDDTIPSGYDPDDTLQTKARSTRQRLTAIRSKPVASTQILHVRARPPQDTGIAAARNRIDLLL